jgi:hypothetical protein
MIAPRGVTGTGARVFATLAPLVLASAAKTVSFRIKHRVQRLLNGAARHLAQVIANPRLIDLYHLPHRFGLLVLIHSLLLSANLKEAIITFKCAKEILRYRA